MTRFAPTQKSSAKISEFATFFKEPYYIGKTRLVNLYWVEIEKENAIFSLHTSSQKSSLLKITEKYLKNNQLPIVAINAGGFYLSDTKKKPMAYGYNLFVHDGEVWQFPGNGRITLIEKNGQLKIKYLKAGGSLKIGDKNFTWVGNRCVKKPNQTAVVIFGVCDIKFATKTTENRHSFRFPIPESLQINGEQEKILLGIGINSKGKPFVAVKSKRTLNLLKYAYILMINGTESRSIKLGDIIHQVSIDTYKVSTHDQSVSLSFSIPFDKTKIKNTISKEIITVNGIIKPLQKDFLKSWSVILETSKKIIFFLVDSCPKKPGVEGLNTFELQELLAKKFDFKSCAVCDSGQTSKLCVNIGGKLRIFGNLHYVNYSAKKPYPDGVNGRAIPSAVVAL